MATTWIKPLKIGGKRKRVSVISDIIDYIKNPQKTNDGKLISSYACDSRVADEQFMLSKRDYNLLANIEHGGKEVIAYHIRQSFKPGEVDAETANKIGYELAKSFTKGNHAFIVATHVDKKHIHNHIIFNSITLSKDRKFNNFWQSHKVVRYISDMLCIENGLSIIKNPKLPKGKNYAEWLGNKEPTWQDKLRNKIDEVLPGCSTFEEFLDALRASGYIINNKRKSISVLAPGQKQPSKLNTLKGDHTEDAIRERIAGVRIVTSSTGGRLPETEVPIYTDKKKNVSLLIDIQSKIQEGKSAGYERWARLFNLREAAKTLLFLQENGIDSYEDLIEKSNSISVNFSERQKKIKEIDERLNEISALQKQIGTYGKTRSTYDKYKASGWDKDFYETERADIILHRAAKKYFNDLGYGKNKKLPKMPELKQEYAALLAEKKKLYVGYRDEKNKSREFIIAKNNVNDILGKNDDGKKSHLSRKIPERSEI